MRACFFILFASLLFCQNINTYLGPKQPTSTGQKLVRIQILVNDAEDPSGAQIKEVRFDGKSIPLKPRDIYGFRGQGSFQVRPGTYQLKWTVNRSRVTWPRTETFTNEVEVNPRDLWLQITITGETASIS